MSYITAPSKPPPSADIPRAQSSPLLLCMSRLFVAVAPLLAGAALLPGCIILDLNGTAPGSGTESGSGMGSESGMGSGSGMGMSPPPVHRLPEPSVPRVDLPVLDAAALKRLDEVEQYLWERYQAEGWQIRDTTQTFLGDIIDWLDAASVKGSQAEPPPKPTLEEMQLPDGVQLSLTELDVFPELRGPEGTIPVMRPSFAAYISGLSGATSLEDFLSHHVVPGDPSGPGRLYGGMSTVTKNLGASTWINAFGGPIEPGTLSVLEMAIGCSNQAANDVEQQVGIAASRDWRNTDLLSGHFGDSVLRIQVEFMTHGDQWTGKGKGGWEGAGTVADFKPVAGALYPPGVAILNPSTIGGLQFESRFEIRLWDKKWWIGWNGGWLGYYEATLWGEDLEGNLFASYACEALWYGEVYDPKPTPTKWTWTDMGSGQFASAGWGNAANFRNPSYTDLSGAPQWPDNASPVNPVKPYTPACYTADVLSKGQAPWDRWFYVGGPGGDAPKGDCPAPH